MDMKFLDNDNGQMILIAYLSIIITLIIITVYEFSTLETGESSINRENMDAFYYYKNIRDGINIPDYWNNISEYNNEMSQFANLHGYSLNFIHNNTQVKIIFVDKDLRIDEVINK